MPGLVPFLQVLASTSGNSPSVDNLPALWDWLKTTGPAGFAIVCWWLERQERRDLQKRNDDLVDRLEKVATDGAVAFKSLRDLLMAGRQSHHDTQRDRSSDREVH